MAILAIFTQPAIKKDHYEALRKEVAWEQSQPSGVILHAASFDAAGGIHVVDIWESQAALDEFVGKRLMPAMQKLKVPPPNVEVYPVHNVNAYAPLDQYKLKQAVR